jgi:hypothetical protein
MRPHALAKDAQTTCQLHALRLSSLDPTEPSSLDLEAAVTPIQGSFLTHIARNTATSLLLQTYFLRPIVYSADSEGAPPSQGASPYHFRSRVTAE